MDNSDAKAFRAEDLWVALGLLTRLPLPAHNWDDTRPAAAAAWAYPLVGAVLATLAASLGHILLLAGLPAAFVAAALLLALSLLTGAMHEDGLADAADGLWGGFDAERRLEIMKDSHIGAYGVIALIVGFALRWSALTALLSAGHVWAPLLICAMASRAGMVALMATLPHARSSGLSHLTGRPGTRALLTALVLCAIAALVVYGVAAFTLALPFVLATLACRQIAKAKINGQTGDILGATQQVCEITLLATLAALLP